MTLALKVHGPPGTGKTEMLRRAARKALDDGIDPRDLAAISFTRAAAGELRNRLADECQIDPDELKGVGTIHSLARRLLEANTDLLVDGKALKEFMETTRFDFDARAYAEGSDDHYGDGPLTDVTQIGNFCLAFYDWFRSTLQRDLEQALWAYQGDVPRNDKRGALAALKRFLPLYEDYLRQTGRWDFASLLVRVCALRERPVDWRVLLVDEAQDLSPLLMAVVRLWADGRERVTLAGDPNQAIYTFQGANPALFEVFPAQTYNLVDSHRLPADLVGYARRVLFAGGEAKDFPWQGRERDVEHDGSLFVLARTRRLVALEVAELMQAGTPFWALRGPDPLRTGACRAMQSALQLGAERQTTLRDLERILEHIPSKPWLVRGAKTGISRAIGLHGPYHQIGIDQLADYKLTPALLSLLADQAPWEAFAKVESQTLDYFRRVVLLHGRGALTAEPKITTSTIHGAKGHERDGVLLVNDWAGKPYGSLWSQDRETRAAEYRVAYVGVSRSRGHLEIRPGGRRRFPFPTWGAA